MWPITQKVTLWELRKVSTLVSLRSPPRLTKDDTFCYWQISIWLKCHFETIQLYRPVPVPVLASFPFLLFYLGVPIWPFFVWWVTYNKNIFCECNHSDASAWFSWNPKKIKKKHNPRITVFLLLIIYILSKFEVNIFSNNRKIAKMSNILHDDNADNAVGSTTISCYFPKTATF